MFVAESANSVSYNRQLKAPELTKKSTSIYNSTSFYVKSSMGDSASQ